MEATKSLDTNVGSKTFAEAYDRVKRARKAFENAKELLERHCHEHGCGELDE